jgi:hypothetical protein
VAAKDALRREPLHEAAAALGLADLPASVLDDLALAGLAAAVTDGVGPRSP